MSQGIAMRALLKSFVLAAAGLAAAAGASAAGVGTTGAQFLKVGVGARPLAMGCAFAALADDANAVNWNPGALAVVRRKNLTASYNSLFKDQNQGFLGYAAPAGAAGTMAVGLNYLIIAKIEKRAGDTEEPDSTFNNQNFAFGLSYGRAGPAAGLSLGGTLKYIREELDTFRGNTMALDFGALYRTPVPHLTAAAAVLNLGADIGPDPLPLTLKAGAAYRPLGQRLALASDIDWLAQDRRAYWDLGAEYWLDSILALRAGYQFGRAADQLGTMAGFGAGLGVQMRRFSFDYAFVPFGDLGDTHRITLGVRFE